MTWIAELSKSAEKDFRRLPRDARDRIARAIDELEVNPRRGDVILLRGAQWKGRRRKRVGPYRIIFTVDDTTNTVAISAILIRSKRTYR